MREFVKDQGKPRKDLRKTTQVNDLACFFSVFYTGGQFSPEGIP
jgi:hypothetical protein